MKSRVLVACFLLLAAACGGASAVTTSFELATDTTAGPAGLEESRVAAPEATAPTSTAMSSAEAPPGPPAYPAPTPGMVDRWLPDIRATYPHDPAAFTQGLIVVDGELYESTGLYGQSDVRAVDLVSGELMARVALAPELFGEGLAHVDGHLIQLSFQEQTAIVWTRQLEEVGRFTYEGEGWGLCDDGERLVMSDGTATLHFRNRTTFEPLGTVEATLDGEPVLALNELECVGGLVFANVWKSTDIMVIDPQDGAVTAVVDASRLEGPREPNDAAVLNGIAHDPDRGVFYVTGKLWPSLYEVIFVAS